jgi:pimeloyl-ACP methyl ester carboxylesterase
MHFVLVHGAYHGAWCWDLLRPELERSGHRVTAVDMPIGDPAAGAAEYARAIVDAVDWGQAPVVVAHSMSGLVAPLVATARPVERLVFLAAFLAQPGTSANEQRKAEPIDPPTAPSTAEWTSLGDDVWAIGANTATELFFHDVPPDVAGWAVQHLRPQCYRVMGETSPLAAWPDVPSAYIVCRDDRALNADWGRTAARTRLGVEPVEIDGGHSPMLSRPAELARVLIATAATPSTRRPAPGS